MSQWRPALLLVLAVVAATPVRGQTTKQPAPTPASLASFIPAKAGLFVELNGIGGGPTAEKSRNVKRLYDLLFGPDRSAEGGNDWRPMLLRSLGLDTEERLNALLLRQVAIAAPSWQRLADAVMVIRLTKKDRLIDEVFAPDNYDSIDGKGNVIVYQTRTYLSAATNQDVLVISQRSHTDSLYHGAVRLMLEGQGPTLATDEAFLAHVRDLPAQRDGTVYVNLASGQDESGELPFLPLARAAVGIQFRGNLVDFSLQATRSEARTDRARRAASLERLQRLPLTSLAAWSTELNVGGAFRAVMGRQDDAPPYAKLLMQILDVEEFQKNLLDHLGPRAIFVWDQHFGSGMEIPQLALLLESSDPLGCVHSLAGAVQVVVDWFDIKNRADRSSVVRLARSDYLGTAIYEISLPQEGSNTGAPPMPIKPAFAALSDSLAIALSADHIRNLVDAEMGLTPTWASLPDLRSTERESHSIVRMGVAQPALIAQTVDHWLASPDGLLARWLTQTVGAGANGAAATRAAPALGIGTQAGTRPGTVAVARVQRDGRSADRLAPGDVIHGVNGSLLSLDEPTVDLRRRVTEAAMTGEIVLRVERQDTYVDVTIPCRSFALSDADPAAALRQLQGLLKLVEFGAIRAVETTPDRFTAQLTLRFTGVPGQG